MPKPLKVEFIFSEASDRAKVRRISCDMFSAEYVQVAVKAPYDFAWHGSHFYLALHNIRKHEGVTQLDGSLRSSARDIRNKLTFVPPDCALWGWSYNTGQSTPLRPYTSTRS